jgi:hypothetical protein
MVTTKTKAAQLPKEITADDKKIVQEAVELATSYQTYVITTDEQLQETAEALARIKGAFNRAEEARKKITGPIDQAKKAVMDFFRPAVDRLTQAEVILKNATRAYLEKKEIERREAQKKADEERKKQEDAERKRLEEQAEQAALLGDTESAQQFDAQKEQVFVPAPPVPPSVAMPKIPGLNQRKKWKARVVNFAILPDAYKLPDQTKLDGYATATHGNPPIPGVEFYEETIIGSASR